MAQKTLSDDDYARLLAFRVRLREFNHWSAEAAAELGLTHVQHQLLLVIRGHEAPAGPTIGDAAAYLLVKPHTAGELATRVEELGFVKRVADKNDARVVRLKLTPKGRGAVRRLTALHLEELRRLAPAISEF